MRIGFGYDLHRLVPERRLVLGGVEIDFSKGLLGHSDADVLLHAVIDALLGAAGLGDIGRHFPPGDPLYKDISSMELLKRTGELINNSGYSVVNIDATVVCEAPKLSKFSGLMEKNIADALGCSDRAVNVKATTEEGMGPTGRKEAISAYAVALLNTVQPK